MRAVRPPSLAFTPLSTLKFMATLYADSAMGMIELTKICIPPYGGRNGIEGPCDSCKCEQLTRASAR